MYEFGTRYCENIFDEYDPELAITERFNYFQFVNEVRSNADKKQIDFFFLCSGDKGRYDKFISSNNLAGHHIFLQRDESKQLFQDFRLNHIPFKVLLRRDEAIVRMAPGMESDLNSVVLQKFIENFAAGYEEI